MASRNTPLLGYVGDDFTGSTDVMEAFARHGLRTALFTDIPATVRPEDFSDFDVVGIASNSRALPSERMEEVLRPAFHCLASLGCAMVHYKICSTFDSSPAAGSVGRAIELGREIFAERPVPIVVAAPDLGRYCVFGNLFARSGLDSDPFRLDRHPTMMKHPVTPMDESDLRIHLAKQTRLPIELLDILAVTAEDAIDRYDRLSKRDPGAILIDLLLEDQLANVGDVLASQMDGNEALFVVGSSGVEMALGASWSRAGRSPYRSLRSDDSGSLMIPTPRRVDPLLVLSGSCSPVTQKQAERAIENGFVSLPLPGEDLVVAEPGHFLEREFVTRIVSEMKAGKSVVVDTALGPDDPRISATLVSLRGEVTAQELGEPELKALCGERLGALLGRIGKSVLAELPLERIVVTGGDTSFQVARELGIERLEMVAPMAPGSPLCRARGAGSSADGVEFVFKGGQVGKVDLFEKIIQGAL